MEKKISKVREIRHHPRQGKGCNREHRWAIWKGTHCYVGQGSQSEGMDGSTGS